MNALLILLAIVAALPFVAALVLGLCTGRITPAAWTRLDADRRTQPVLFWVLVIFNAAMATAMVCACSTIIG